MTGKSTIYICPLSQLDALIKQVRPSHVMTLLSPDTMVDTPAALRDGMHLKLAVNDIAAPREGLIAPDQSHIAQMLDFVDSWNHEAPMIIHCWAGISRSTAAAFIALCHLNRWDGHETAAARLMRQQARHAQPNRRLVALADQLMGRQGRMISAVEAMGPGEIEFEGVTFTMSARMAAPGQAGAAAAMRSSLPPMNDTSSVIIDLGAVIVAVTDGRPLTLARQGPAFDAAEAQSIARGFEIAGDALPSGAFDPTRHRTLELGLRETVSRRIGVNLGYVEQLYTFGDRGRHPREREGGPRVISVGYLALTRETQMPVPESTAWRQWYDYFPWEDWRDGRPAMIDKLIAPLLREWIAAPKSYAETARRRDRANICFPEDNGSWDEEIVLERFELLYEAGLAAEAQRDGVATLALDGKAVPPPGAPMMSDHRRILATAMGRLRAKLKYRPVVFELMPEDFTLLQLQRTVEAILGSNLHKQNFRRLVENSGLVESTGEIEPQTRGRPAAKFRFRREVLRERLAAGVRISGSR